MSNSRSKGAAPDWYRILGCLLVCGGVLISQSAFAQAAPWEDTAQNVIDLLMGIARGVSIIGVIACGLAALFGKLSWEWAGKIIIGLVLIFGATAVVDYFSAGMGG